MLYTFYRDLPACLSNNAFRDNQLFPIVENVVGIRRDKWHFIFFPAFPGPQKKAVNCKM